MNPEVSDNETEKMYRVAWWSIDGVGVKTYLRILGHFGTAEIAWKSTDNDVIEVLGNTKTLARILDQKRQIQPEKAWEVLVKLRVSVLCANIDQKYPKPLNQIQDPPPVLFVRGQLKDEDSQAVAVVGTRKPTRYGIDLTQQLVGQLAGQGYCIISGLARGIDGVAHRAALDVEGRTIAVMGNGIDTVFPPEHERLAAEIVESGALVSTLSPGKPSLPGFFAVRNRYIAGLARGVLVTEGASKSGTQITVKHAMEQGKPVFAVPGDVSRPMSQGPVEMIKQGAHLVTEVRDVLQVLGGTKGEKIEKSLQLETFTKQQQVILQYLLEGEKEIDEIARACEMSVESLGVELTMLEMDGVVQGHDGKYTITN